MLQLIISMWKPHEFGKKAKKNGTAFAHNNMVYQWLNPKKIGKCKSLRDSRIVCSWHASIWVKSPDSHRVGGVDGSNRLLFDLI